MKRRLLFIVGLIFLAFHLTTSFIYAGEPSVIAGNNFTLGLKTDGTVLFAGSVESFTNDESSFLKDWINIKQIAGKGDHFVGLKADGTVLAKCYDMDYWVNEKCNISTWDNIIKVDATMFSTTMGLKNDSTNLFAIDSSSSLDLSGWENIIQIYQGNILTVGLKDNGALLTTCWFGVCGEHYQKEVDELTKWTDIVQIAQGYGDEDIVGLKSDGSIVALSNCSWDLNGWSDLKQIDANSNYIVGLINDGTVVISGSSYSVSSWSNIIKVSAGSSHTVGLKSDGSVVAAGDNMSGQCDISAWNLGKSSQNNSGDIDNDKDGYTENQGDCDDHDANKFPGKVWYQDLDGDGFGDPDTSTEACEQPASYVDNKTDFCPDEPNMIDPGLYGCGVIVATSQAVVESAQDTQVIEITDNDSKIVGVKVEVPPGALLEDCIITIGTVTKPPSLPSEIKGSGHVIEFGPDGMIFSFPIAIKIPYSINDLNEAGISNPAELEVFTFNTSTLSWENVPVESVDTENKFIICKVSHFSMYTKGNAVSSLPIDSQAANPTSESSSDSGGGCFVSCASNIQP